MKIAKIKKNTGTKFLTVLLAVQNKKTLMITELVQFYVHYPFSSDNIESTI
jgi:hypothetical protein